MKHAANWTLLSADCKVCLGGRSAVLTGRSLGCVEEQPKPTFSLPISTSCTLAYAYHFQNIPFNKLIPSAFRDVEMPFIKVFLSTSETNFKFYLNFFLNLQSPLSFWNLPYSTFSLGVNSGTVAKCNTLNKECLALGFQEDLEIWCTSIPHQKHLCLRNKRSLQHQMCWLQLVWASLQRFVMKWMDWLHG